MSSGRSRSWAMIFTMISCLCYTSLVVAGTRVRVELSRTGSSCDGPHTSVVVAGAQCCLNVSIVPSPGSVKAPFTGFVDSPPPWLRLEFGYNLDRSSELRPSSELYAAVHPRYFLSDIRRDLNQSVGPDAFVGEYPYSPTYQFVVTIPPEASGQVIWARVLVDDPPYGPLYVPTYMTNEWSNVDSVAVLAPCGRDDEARVLSSRVSYSRFTDGYERALELEDSMLAAGWTVALEAAYESAMHIGKYDSALRYLDLIWQNRATIGSWGYRDMDEEQYRRTRQMILDRKNTQEQ
jgi:hypothetical protein